MNLPISIIILTVFQIYIPTNAFTQNVGIESEMRFFRNEIFARHGRKFKSEDLQQHFTSQKWYEPSDNYSISSLSQKEIDAANTIKQIEVALPKLKNEEKVTAIEIFNFIKEYTYKKVDLNKLLIDDFDNLEGKDTIRIHIIETEGQSYKIEYSFLKNNQLMWQEYDANPYLWLGDHELFEKNWDNKFFIGYTATNFDCAKKSKMWELPIDKSVLEMGQRLLSDRGYNITIGEYEEYLKNFKGNLLVYSINETGGTLKIWFEPLKTFILFYAP